MDVPQVRHFALAGVENSLERYLLYLARLLKVEIAHAVRIIEERSGAYQPPVARCKADGTDAVQRHLLALGPLLYGHTVQQSILTCAFFPQLKDSITRHISLHEHPLGVAFVDIRAPVSPDAMIQLDQRACAYIALVERVRRLAERGGIQVDFIGFRVTWVGEYLGVGNLCEDRLREAAFDGYEHRPVLLIAV